MEFCCTPLLSGVMDEVEAADTASVLGALADPARLRIVSMLASQGSACGCDLESPLGLTQPTVSHHLKVLREAGLVRGERKGRWVHYSIVEHRLEQVREVFGPSEMEPV